MAIRPEELRGRLAEAVRTYGDWVRWEQGAPCACRAATSLRMTAGCRRCDGEGFTWTGARKLKGIVMPAHLDRRLSSMGWLTPGDLTFLPDSRARVHDFDRITLLAPLPVEPEVLTRGQAAHDGVAGLAANEDRLAYQAVRPIDCFLHDRPDTHLIAGDAYVLDGKRLRWLRAPADGTIFVVTYEALTEWVAFSTPMETIDRGGSLGQRVLLRKRHLVNLAESPRGDAAGASRIPG